MAQSREERRAYYQDNKDRIKATRLDKAFKEAFSAVREGNFEEFIPSTGDAGYNFELTELYACGKLFLPKSFYRGLQLLSAKLGVPTSSVLTSLVGALLAGDLDMRVTHTVDYGETKVASLDHLCKFPLYTRGNPNQINSTSLDLLDVTLKSREDILRNAVQ